MDENTFEKRSRFLSSLREFRPELAEFITLCMCAEPVDDRRRFVQRRLQHLMHDGEGLGYDRLTQKMSALEQALSHNLGGEELVRLVRELLDAALYALTFTGVTPALWDEPPVTPLTKKWRLVVADDDRIVREMMVQLFSSEAELYAASNGKEAFAFIKEYHPHLVILDDFMPEMTGLKLIESLHASREFSHIPVIMLTGSDRPRDKERAMLAGAIDYIIKPFEPAVLKQRVGLQLQTV